MRQRTIIHRIDTFPRFLLVISALDRTDKHLFFFSEHDISQEEKREKKNNSNQRPVCIIAVDCKNGDDRYVDIALGLMVVWKSEGWSCDDANAIPLTDYFV